MTRLRVWLMWTLRDPWDRFNPDWVARFEALCAELPDPYAGA